MADNGQWSSSLLGSEQLAGNTLPEHHSALALLQQLDHAWFHDNLLKPRVGLINAFLPSSSSPLSPYQSIELMDAAHSKWASSFSHLRQHRDMPSARFEALPRAQRRTLTSTRISHKDPSKGSENALQSDHQPSKVAGPRDFAARPLVSQRHMCSTALADTVLVPPRTLQAWVVKDIRDLKDYQAKEYPRARKLESIESGKQLEVPLVDTQLPQPALRVLEKKRAHRKSSKSMTAVEFDELQGFMDLGFHFSQDDLTPRVVSMFPALRHNLGEEGNHGRIRRAISTDKQGSLEAWLVRRSAAPLRDWQTPATRENMKEHLKFWARAVASTVRQEC